MIDQRSQLEEVRKHSMGILNSESTVRIEVAVPGAAYDVVLGPGLLDRLPDVVQLPPRAEQGVIVTSDVIYSLYGERVERGFTSLGLRVRVVRVPEGEVAKSLTTLEECWREFARFDLERKDVVIALGGGVVGDLAGFAAATWDRGVNVLQIPTTLLAQVDSAIGGKTGVNLPEGKNLVGAFHQPLTVIADTLTLRTLPERERRSGLAEVLKYGFIADPPVLEMLESSPDAAIAGEPDLITELVRRNVGVKAAIVAADEREGGQRSLLNYGHTVGHAIETLSSYERYRHGEAIAIGMVFAARLGERLGISEPGMAAQTVRLLKLLGLPTGGISIDRDAAWEVMRRDKKARSGVRFVLCERPGKAVLIDPPDTDVVNEVLDTLSV